MRSHAVCVSARAAGRCNEKPPKADSGYRPIELFERADDWLFY
jgi:hypothetical protein